MPPKTKDLHHDRGDGVCNHCFEEFPCDSSKENPWQHTTPVSQYEREIAEQARLASDRKYEESIAEYKRLFEKFGIDYYFPRYGHRDIGRDTVNMKAGKMLEILHRIEELEAKNESELSV